MRSARMYTSLCYIQNYVLVLSNICSNEQKRSFFFVGKNLSLLTMYFL